MVGWLASFMRLGDWEMPRQPKHFVESHHKFLLYIDILGFFGTSLINAYNQEKEIKSVGAFIHSRCLEHCHVFTTVPHSKDFHFLILTKPIESLIRNSGGVFPVAPIVLEILDLLYLECDLRAMRKIHTRMNDQALPPEVRHKFLVAWHYYQKALGKTLEFFERNAFDLHAIRPEHNWQDACWDEQSVTTYPFALTPQQFGFLLAFSYIDWDDAYEAAVASVVLEELEKSGFSGRCEYYHNRAALGDLKVYYVGIGLKDAKGKQFGDYDWWSLLEAHLLEALTRKGIPLSKTTLSEQASMEGIRMDRHFCGAILMEDGSSTLVIEHPDRLGTSAFTELVKRQLFEHIPGIQRP